MKKIISVLLSAMMLLTGINIAFAAGYDAESMTTKFYLTEESVPTYVGRNMNSLYRSNSTASNAIPHIAYGDKYTDKYNYTTGALYSYNWDGPMMKLENEPFDFSVPYMCYGGSGLTNIDAANNSINIKMAMPHTAELNDGVYISFYYRSKSSFEGLGIKAGQTLTGADTNMRLYTRKNTGGWESSGYVQQVNGGSNVITIPADNKWHKAEFTVYLENDSLMGLVADDILNMALGFSDTTQPAFIEFAGFRVGVLDIDREPSNNKTFTDISWHLQNKSYTGIKINGSAMEPVEGNNYTVTSTLNSDGTVAAPDFEVVTADGRAVSYKLDKLAWNKYRYTITAPGYDRLLENNADISFRMRNGGYNMSQGTTTYTKKNGELITADTYTVTVEPEDNFTMYPLVNRDDSVVHGCNNEWRGEWVEYSTYVRPIESWTDEPEFKEGYTLKLKKPENPVQAASNNGFNSMQATFNLGSEDMVQKGDIIYYSFYIKADADTVRFQPRFLGTYVIDEDTTQTIGRNGKLLSIARKYPNNEIKQQGSDLANSDTHFMLNVKDKWIKYVGYYLVEDECYIMDEIKLALWFNQFARPDYTAATIKLSDFRCGVLRGYELKSSSSNNEYITALNRAAYKDASAAFEISVNGTLIATNGALNVSAQADRPSPVITAQTYHGAVDTKLTRIGGGHEVPGTYQLKVYKPGYDRTIAENGTQTYGYLNRPPVQAADGTWSTPNADVSSIAQSGLVKTYTITVSQSDDYKNYIYTIDGTDADSFTNVKGNSATYGVMKNKFAEEDSFYMIIASYDSEGRLKSVAADEYIYDGEETNSYTQATIGLSEEEARNIKVFFWNKDFTALDVVTK